MSRPKDQGKNVYALVLVYTPKGQRKRPGEGKAYDFSTGGVFSANSKRTYGRKKYIANEGWKPKIPSRKRSV